MNTQALAVVVLPMLPAILQALTEYPLGAAVLVLLAAIYAFRKHK